VFGNSMFTCFAYAGGALAGAGRALADGLDCAYIADVAVHPAHQGRGLGTAIIRQLVARCEGHKKIILYANPGSEPFYARLGFLRMNTAMAIWHDPARAIESGLLSTTGSRTPLPARQPGRVRTGDVGLRHPDADQTAMRPQARVRATKSDRSGSIA
jgi:Acetyltransferase (GNAT) family